MTNNYIYDIPVIEEILPHRRPFLFVDRVINFKAGEKIIAEKDLLPDESFFAGHFPGQPIMPGVLVSEALAQTSGLLLGLTREKEGMSMGEEKMNLFLANVDIKFFTPAKPGDTLRLEASIKKGYGSLFLFKVDAFVGTNPVAKGTLTLSEKNKRLLKNRENIVSRANQDSWRNILTGIVLRLSWIWNRESKHEKRYTNHDFLI